MRTELYLLLSIIILTGFDFTGAFNIHHQHQQWIVQRTYHQDRIKSMPAGIQCSDIQNAVRVVTDDAGSTGDCVCPKDHVFHFDARERAVCIGEESICKGKKKKIFFIVIMVLILRPLQGFSIDLLTLFGLNQNVDKKGRDDSPILGPIVF